MTIWNCFLCCQIIQSCIKSKWINIKKSHEYDLKLKKYSKNNDLKKFDEILSFKNMKKISNLLIKNG